MYDKILVATDWSEPSQRALELATGLARLSGGELRLLYAYEMERLVPAGSGPLTAAVRDTAEGPIEAQAARVEVTAVQLAGQGIRATGVVRPCLFGAVVQEILAEVEDAGTDLLVVGTRGRGALEGILLGSTTQKLLHLAKVPVLVVH